MYGSQIWGQVNNSNVKRVIRQQNKAIRTISFVNYDTPTEVLYKSLKILKFSENVKTLNLLFIYNSFNNHLPLVLKNVFHFDCRVNKYNMRQSDCILSLPKVFTSTYGLESIEYKSIALWNRLATKFNDVNLNIIKNNEFKKVINIFLHI